MKKTIVLCVGALFGALVACGGGGTPSPGLQDNGGVHDVVQPDIVVPGDTITGEDGTAEDVLPRGPALLQAQLTPSGGLMTSEKYKLSAAVGSWDGGWYLWNNKYRLVTGFEP